MTERPIDKTIKKYISKTDEKTTGLTLISSGTGKGKTHAILKYINDALTSGRYERVVFIAPRHNLLKEINEKLTFLNSNEILYLHSSIDNIKDNISFVDIDLLKDKIIKNFIVKLEDISRYFDADTNVPEELSNGYIKIKGELRSYIQKRKRQPVDDEYDEVHKLFPEDIKNSTKVILMTMDKLFYRLDTLNKENLILSQSLFTEKTLVIIDEYDKCYEIALNNCAADKNNLDDLLSLIQTARQFISDNDPRWRRMLDDEDILEERQLLCEKIDSVHKQYGILNNFEFDNPSNERVELFVSRSQTVVASQGKKQYYSLSIQPQKTKLELTEKKNDFSLPAMALACKDIVRQILNLIYHVGQNYMKNVGNVTYEESLLFGISQVLNRTSNDARELVNYAIINSIKTQSLRISADDYISDLSVCNNGFSHCYFENSPGSNHSYLRTSGIDLTPENIFVWLARHSNVVALSATGQIPTVLNPELTYIQHCVADTLDLYSPEEFNGSANENEEYENITCEVICSFNSDRLRLIEALLELIRSNWIGISFDESKLDSFINEFIDNLNEGDDYSFDRELKRFFAFCKYIFTPTAFSGLVILNSKYKYVKALRKFVDKIASVFGSSFELSENIYLIDASNYEATLSIIQNKLNNDIRCIVISNREAIGQGVNIQYDRDFNFFYQEEPTHIFPIQSADDPLPQSEVNKLIYLLMKLHSCGEITEYEMKEKIKRVVNKNPISINNLPSVKNAKAAAFIQGLGRTSRTGSKESHIYIYFDEELCKDLDFSTLMAEMTPELLTVKKCVEQYKSDYESELIYRMNIQEHALCENSNRLQSNIDQLISVFTNNLLPEAHRQEAKKRYENLRTFLLSHGPYITSINQLKDDEKSLFEALGYVYFDTNPPKVLSFLSRDESYCENLICCFEGEMNNLKSIKFSQLKPLRSYRNVDAPCWVINPKAFNLLQGALGEEKFKDCFEALKNPYKLEELPLDEYEVCGDYLVENTDVYIDVKNFSEAGGARDITEFAKRKLETIRQINPNGKLILVNVFAENRYMDPIENIPDILAVTNILDKKGLKRETLNEIYKWIDDNT